MKSSKQDNKKPDESRRNFLGKGIALAGGLILVPLWVEGCGGDNQGDGRTSKKPKKSGGGGTPSGDGGSSDGGTTPQAAYECVDPSALGSKQNVKVTVKYKGDHVAWTDPKLKKTGLTGDDGARAMGDVEVEKYYKDYKTDNPLGTAYVVDEHVLTIKEGDSVRLCNCFVVLDPRGVAKVAKNPRADVVVKNHYFRFEPRVHDIATKGNVSWENKDPVNHAISTPPVTPGLPNVQISDGGTATPGKTVSTKVAGTAGFFKKGYYGVACSLHAWELGRIIVSDHGYVGVSSKENKCEVALADVADGKYELQIWHETSATPIKTQEVEVKAGAVEFAVELDKIA